MSPRSKRESFRREGEGPRAKRAAFFNVGDPIVWGKWMNKPGKIVRFFDDGRGNPMIEIEPVPKGLKKNKMMPLFRIRHHRALKTATRVADRYLQKVSKARGVKAEHEPYAWDPHRS